MPPAERKHLLVIDDDFAIRRLVRAILERSHGCEVDEAPGGQEAIARLMERTYDAIVLDLMMPRGNGFEVLNFLNEAHITVPCIVMSAAAQKVLDKIDGPNIVAKVRKPFDIGDLVDATRQAFES